MNTMANIIISMIQADLIWENKEANLINFEDKIKKLSSKTHVVILPEMFNTGFSMNSQLLGEKMDGQTVSWMRRICIENRIILTGSLIIEEDGSFYNRMIWMMPNGQLGYYNKRHLFGFAGEDKHFCGGTQRMITSVNGWRFNLQVCYDLRFPVWSRQQIRENNEPEFDVLIYVANWPEQRAHAWRSLLTARAIENQSYVFGVNRIGQDGNNLTYAGDSLAIDPLGQILNEPSNSENIFTIELKSEFIKEVRARFPFIKDADSFSII
jgi:predicted amidohydrolase